MILVALAAGLALAFEMGRIRERGAAADRLETLTSAAIDGGPGRPIRLAELGGLPVPVSRYLRFALRDEQLPVSLARFSQHGELRTDVASPQWRRFTATQAVAPRVPGFIWDARVTFAPLIHVRVVDSYVEGAGAGSVSLLSAFRMSESRGESLNEGELYRYLAEAPLYPTALVPSERLRWSPIDDARALATLTDRGATISVEFRFAGSGEVTAIHAASRPRLSGGDYVPTPWEGHWRSYEEQSGMRVPGEGDVGWWLDGVWQPVWRGQIVSPSFVFAGE
jgi:hypothetical protein